MDFLKVTAVPIYAAPRVEAQKEKYPQSGASLEELMTYEGIKEVEQSINTWLPRIVRGFKTIDELKNVQGISENSFFWID